MGYSFGYGPYVTSSVAAAQDIITFYFGWLKLFPEFNGRKLIISGESYAGKYLPAWADAFLTYNEEQTVCVEVLYDFIYDQALYML